MPPAQGPKSPTQSVAQVPNQNKKPNKNEYRPEKVAEAEEVLEKLTSLENRLDEILLDYDGETTNAQTNFGKIMTGKIDSQKTIDDAKSEFIRIFRLAQSKLINFQSEIPKESEFNTFNQKEKPIFISAYNRIKSKIETRVLESNKRLRDVDLPFEEMLKNAESNIPEKVTVRKVEEINKHRAVIFGLEKEFNIYKQELEDKVKDKNGPGKILEDVKADYISKLEDLRSRLEIQSASLKDMSVSDGRPEKKLKTATEKKLESLKRKLMPDQDGNDPLSSIFEKKRDDTKVKLEEEIEAEAKISIALSSLRVRSQAKNKTPEEASAIKEELTALVNQRSLNFNNFRDLVQDINFGGNKSFGPSPTLIDDAVYFAHPPQEELNLINGRNGNERLVAKYFINGHLRTNKVIDEINKNLEGKTFEITAESALVDIKTYTSNLRSIGKDIDDAYDKLEIGKKYKDEDKQDFLGAITTESWLVEDLERKVQVEISKLSNPGATTLSEPDKYSLKKYEYVIKLIAKLRDTSSITPIEGNSKSLVDKLKEKLDRSRSLKESELKEKIKSIEDKLNESEKELNTASGEIIQIRGANLARVKSEKEAINSSNDSRLSKEFQSLRINKKDPSLTFNEANDMGGRMKDVRAIITDARRETEDMLDHFDATDTIKFKKYEKIKKRLLAKVRRQKRRAASMGWRYLGLLNWKEKGMYLGDKLIQPIGEGTSWVADLISDKFTADI